MQITKSQIISALESRGEHDRAAQARAQLPETVDPDTDADLLSSLGVDPTAVLDGVPGGVDDSDTSHGTTSGTDEEALGADGTLTGEPEGWGGSGEREDGPGGLAGGLGGGVR